MNKLKFLTIAAATSMMLFSCGGSETSNTTVEETVTEEVVSEGPVEIDPMEDKGVGPFTGTIEFGDLDQVMVDAGLELFKSKCKACHKVEKRKIGPAMKGLTERRTPEWIMNMILDPDRMVKENKIARDLLMEYSAPMANQSLTEEEARSILEYFRTIN